MKRTLPLCLLAALAASPAVTQATPEPGITLYHVGYDNSPLDNFGAFTGLPNRNYQRLTMLWSHTFIDNPARNHFHWIGQYSYSGTPLDPQPGFSSNNSVPEPYQDDDGLSLLAGSGVFEGKLISGLGPAALPNDEIELEYGNLAIYPIDDFFPFDNAPHPAGPDVAEFHPAHYLLNTLNGTFKESVADVTIGMKLVGLTPGLTIYGQDGAVLMDEVDEVMTLGAGSDWVFEPVFGVDADAPIGSQYAATFILQDLSPTATYGDSAEFTFNFIAVPEPGTALVGLLAMAGVSWRRR